MRQILRANLLTRFNAILGSLFVVVAIVGPLQDGLFGIVLVANAATGIVQELRAKRALDRLAILTEPHARVVRGGVVADLPIEEVVLDDVLELRPGDQVPVDAVVLESAGLEVDESLLSGEADLVPKAAGHGLLSGSFVVAGTGWARATGVGAACYAARLESQARRFSLISSELQRGTNQILRIVTWVMVPAGAALVVTQVFRSHQTLDDALRGSVAGVAAMVPEGLVLLTSVAFAVSTVRLASRRVLVQELAGIEGLARVDVLCIDKTGTLTAPGMHLVSVTPLRGHTTAQVEEVLAAMAAADPAPNATMRAVAAHYPQSPGWSATGGVPFSSARRWSATSFADQGTWVLGAPDTLAPHLRHEAGPEVAGTGSGRMLLLAESPAPLTDHGTPELLAPAALLSFAEELRPDAASTIAFLLEQGVTVKVLSGDAPASVAAIAAAVGIPGAEQPGDASALSEGDAPLEQALVTTNVFGRVHPDQKVAAVRLLRGGGHVVAMVGDGVNDVQALKEADLGIAMGSGSPSSRAVARIVLLDSRFSAVPEILAEGRRVIANIERVARLFVTKTVYAALLAIVVALTALPFPFFPRHLTVVSTLTIGVPGFFLALAGGAPRASHGFTMRVLRFTIPTGIAAAAATLASYGLARAGDTNATQARTAALLALSAVGLWVLGMVARPLHPMRLLLVLAMGGSLAFVFLCPPVADWLLLQLPPATVLIETALSVVAALVLLNLWFALWSERVWRWGERLAGPPR